MRDLPSEWVPPYFTIDHEILFNKMVYELTDDIIARSVELGFKEIILRSSAIGEHLDQRGRFVSYEIHDLADKEHIAHCLNCVVCEAKSATAKMALVIQLLLRVSAKGHLSNERRVSATRNHWKIEVELPKYESIRTNSQRDVPASINQQLLAAKGSLSKRLFGSVGSWVNSTFESRVHIEWVLEGERLWLVQLDLEDDAPDIGIDPRQISAFDPHCHCPDETIDPLIRWSEFKDPKFRKVSAIAGFADQTNGAYPDLFVLRVTDAIELLKAGALPTKLRAVIGERLVCRVDLRPSARGKMQGLNLPRTDTTYPGKVAEFIEGTIKTWVAAGIKSSDGIFIIHEYLPAITGVWAEATPSSRTVQVDSLWGLPDGLQYLDHDSFEFDLMVEQVVSEYIRYKGWYVAELEDGSWQRRQVRRDLTRHSSLPREYVSHIAQVTHRLASEAGERLRVMWFVDVAKPGIAALFPWFSHKPEVDSLDLLTGGAQDQSILRTLPPYPVRSLEDLEELPPGRLRLQLDPNAECMRDNSLIERIASLAKEGGHTVEVRGSGLCHAFYLLRSFGVAVVTPFTRKYSRVRGRQTFGKLVRDGIPARIESRGERVRLVQLAASERRRALAAKLIEEAQEVAGSTNTQDIASELADVLEVVRSIATVEGVEWPDVEKRAAEKRVKVGSFTEGRILMETDIPSRRKKGGQRRTANNDPFSVKEQEDGVLVPFLGLIEDGTEFSYRKRVYAMRLRPEGVFLEELRERDADPQLNLPLIIEK